MKVYKCAFTDEELCSDSMPATIEYNGLIMKVPAKFVTAEDADEDDPNPEQVLDVVMYYNLNETTYTKKTYRGHLKSFFAKVCARLEEKGGDLTVDAFKKDSMVFVKEILATFDEWQFYTGAGFDDSGVIVLSKWVGEECFFYYWLPAIVEQKC
ncbi:translationally controlled tumour protein [Kipferlia bialata]|uniref:Translationally controlled tumour protein n=1 Tax=Kipferlia bialata TaxID=797122 RepID=A0A9K3CV99_9EUKA|nr:translationally controlled tumour protein [Kipferlia bialata]|eukprot:g3350.t1